MQWTRKKRWHMEGARERERVNLPQWFLITLHTGVPTGMQGVEVSPAYNYHGVIVSSVDY